VSRAPAGTWRFLAAAALVAAAAWWGVQTLAARRMCRDIADLIGSREPAGGSDEALSRMMMAADDLRAGAYADVSRLLLARELAPAEQEAARRFLVRHTSARQRFVALVDEARQCEAEGAGVVGVRAALIAALHAAADDDPVRVAALLGLAERALARPAGGGESGGGGRERALALAVAVEPALCLGREVLTEGCGPAQQVLSRAAGHFRREQYDEAISLLTLGAALLGVPAAPALSADGGCAWIDTLVESPWPEVSAGQSRAKVAFCLKVAEAQPLSPAVRRLVREARRASDREQHAEAQWWAELALDALGVGRDAVLTGDAREAQP